MPSKKKNNTHKPNKNYVQWRNYEKRGIMFLHRRKSEYNFFLFFHSSVLYFHRYFLNVYLLYVPFILCDCDSYGNVIRRRKILFFFHPFATMFVYHKLKIHRKKYKTKKQEQKTHRSLYLLLIILYACYIICSKNFKHFSMEKIHCRHFTN